jgi:DNA-binding MarR family transcriptional regulator
MTRRQDAVHPLEKLGLRPTTHTLRVLEVIGNWTPAQPEPGSGPSSRQIAEQAGIRHESQISRLLTRLEGAGLIKVTRRGRHISGGPYSWSLTAKGKEVWRVIEAQREG